MHVRHYFRRHTVKMALTQGLTRLAPTLGERPGRVVVLCYHAVHPDKRTSSASPDLFAAHLRWLVEHCDVVPLSAIPARARARTAHHRPVVAVTFDDGYRDNVEIALPLLEQHRVPATFFVTSGLVGRDPAVFDRFAFLLRGGPDEYAPMTWSQVRELEAAGMEIGDHTYRHPNLALHPAATVREELTRSKEILESELGHAVASFAYPFGKDHRHVTSEVRDVVASLGYRVAVAVRHRGVTSTDPPLDLPRFTVFKDPVERLAAKVAGPWDIVGWGQQRAPSWLARLVSPDDFGLDEAAV